MQNDTLIKFITSLVDSAQLFDKEDGTTSEHYRESKKAIFSAIHNALDELKIKRGEVRGELLRDCGVTKGTH